LRVITASGESVDLGTTETTPTIGITDFSRRVTDDFGVTTVVERDFSRRLSVRLALPFANVDGLQQRLAALRATAAQWIADERFAWLNVQGYYKDFSIDLNTPPISYCTLTVEGLAENGAYSDPGGDPAPDDQVSTLRLLQPVAVEGAVLASSTVAEDSRPEWSALTIYPVGAQVIKAATHRAYESVVAGNLGNDPAGESGKWLDVGPTNRWAMFDQALGTTTTAGSSITVTLNAGAVTGVALLDVIASSVRVRGTGYDRTTPASAGAVTFLDLPGTTGTVTVTISGQGPVSVGTLLIGQVVGLGLTEAAPTAGITDFSRKATDDFGEVTVVERAFAKRMTANALIRTDALDLVASRIATVRARPSLWIGAAGVDTLTVYGFFKDFAIEAGENVSKLALSIEGLSRAAKIEPLKVEVDWPSITDPAGTKPADGATVGMTDAEANAALINAANAELGRIRNRALSFPSPDGASVYTLHRREETSRVEGFKAVAETFDLLGAVGRYGTAFIFSDGAVFAQDDQAGGTNYVSVSAALNKNKATIEDVRQVLVGPGGAYARALTILDVNGRAIGNTATNDGKTGTWTFVTDTFTIETPDGEQLFYADDQGVKMHHVEVDTLAIGAMDPEFIAAQTPFNGREGTQELPGGVIMKWGRLRTPIDDEAEITITFEKPFPISCDSFVPTPFIYQFSNLKDLWLQVVGEPTRLSATIATQAATHNQQHLDGVNWLAFGR